MARLRSRLFFLAFVRESLCGYHVDFISMTAPSFDGTKLQLTVAVPRVAAGSNISFPAVLMANSWDMPKIEYLGAQKVWGAAGYVILEYEVMRVLHSICSPA